MDYHVIVKAPAGILPTFMQFVNNIIARKLGALHDWQGKFWHRRYSAEPILDQEALVGRVKYLFMHGVKEGLVAHHQHWPGLTAWPELCQGRSRSFAWPGAIDSSAGGVELKVACLPGYDDLRPEDFSRAMRELCQDAEQEAQAQRVDKAILGAQRVLNQDPHARPVTCKRSPRPFCHTACLATKQAFIEGYRAFVNAYAYASALLRAGAQNVRLPAYAYPPPLPYAWRIAKPPLGTVIMA